MRVYLIINRLIIVECKKGNYQTCNFGLILRNSDHFFPFWVIEVLDPSSSLVCKGAHFEVAPLSSVAKHLATYVAGRLAADPAGSCTAIQLLGRWGLGFGNHEKQEPTRALQLACCAFASCAQSHADILRRSSFRGCSCRLRSCFRTSGLHRISLSLYWARVFQEMSLHAAALPRA